MLLRCNVPKFLNRLLALPIAEQNQLFAELEERIAANIEQAIEAGSYEVGVETVIADSLAIAGRETLYEHPGTGAVTELVEIVRRAYDVEDEVQLIRIIIEGMAGHVPTALVALTMDDTLSICDKLNRCLGYDREAWTAMAAASMHAEDDDPDGGAWH